MAPVVVVVVVVVVVGVGVVVVNLNLARNFKMRNVPILFSQLHYNKLPIWPGGMRGAIESAAPAFRQERSVLSHKPSSSLVLA